LKDRKYLMESDEEALRLELKTERNAVEKQALWAGMRAGMRVADIGCGSGITTAILHDLVQPGGIATGVDFSDKRLKHAVDNYGKTGIEFVCSDITKPLDSLGKFDFIWIRFVLEYFLSHATQIVNNLSGILNPGGTLCLIDLDYNCLSHFGLSLKMEKTLFDIMESLKEKADFDPYVGRKLYSFLYDLGYEEIKVDVGAHHLIYGELRETDAFNWLKKLEVATKRINYQFEEYDGGYAEFLEEFKGFFASPRRFTYTPIICCRGRKPLP
jgi:ubiquinone/menaquinone biosynthesis C-methylase UbiE